MRTPGPRSLAALAALSLSVAAAGVLVVTQSGPGSSDSADRLTGAPATAPLGTPDEAPPSVPPSTAAASPTPAAAAPAAPETRPATSAPRASTNTPTTRTPTGPRRTETAPEQAPDDGTGYGATPGVVTHAFDPSRRTYSATRSGITLTATFSAVRARTGEAVSIAVKGSRGEPTCCALHVLYGDGGGDDDQETGCPRPAVTSRSADFTHTWNRAQRWVLQLQASQSGCGGGDPSVVMRVTVETSPGTVTSNGPAKPVVEVNSSTPPRPGDSSYASYWGRAEETDGWLTKLVLDYGDGSAPKTFPGDQRRCANGPGGQPPNSYADLPYQPPHQHHYVEPGTYVVTLTAYSAGCDGKAVQTSSAQFSYTA